jgi:hypothetical protein
MNLVGIKISGRRAKSVDENHNSFPPFDCHFDKLSVRSGRAWVIICPSIISLEISLEYSGAVLLINLHHAWNPSSNAEGTQSDLRGTQGVLRRINERAYSIRPLVTPMSARENPQDDLHRGKF